jgi:ubiquinone/menaquinone biosynthesis C-methylase UbiE
MAIHPQANSFDRAAGDYERARPDYPQEAATLLAERLDLRAGRRVVDIAAGTGKLTRVLEASGAEVVAVEPVPGMRERLAAASPGVQLLDGTAEALPLEDASVDAATVAQAFHWFDGDRALAEIHRVVRGEGRLAVLYNRRRLEDPLQAAIEEILRPVRSQTPAHESERWREAFSRTGLWVAAGEEQTEHVQQLDRAGVVARVASTSFIAGLPDGPRAELLGRIGALVEGREEPMLLPYVCELSFYERVPVGPA